MTDHPMLYQGSMVRGLLREIDKPGNGKTNTRRLFKGIEHQENGNWHIFGGIVDVAERDVPKHAPDYVRIQVGDRLWVRETVIGEERLDGTDGVRYVADNAFIPIASTQQAATYWLDLHNYSAPHGTTSLRGKRVPSIHMPRWASRITLNVTGVKVERLQDISDADARAEGLSQVTKDGKLFKFGIADRDGLPGNDDDGWHWKDWEVSPIRAYAKLWDHINGVGAWNRNPWVVSYTFIPTLQNIDRIAAR
jgi:hypothetical protein